MIFQSAIKSIIIIIAFFSEMKECCAQLYTSLGENSHNQLFIGTGYSNSFGNITFGINHKKYFRVIKKNIVGILDFSLPVSDMSYTRFVFRKGFQIEIFHKENFKIPFSIISSSVHKELIFLKFNDFVTDFHVMPGIYSKKFTLALDLSLKILWRHKAHYTYDYFNLSEIDRAKTAKKIDPFCFNAGIIFAYNFHRLNFIVLAGYQQRNNIEYIQNRFYAFTNVGYTLNFKKR